MFLRFLRLSALLTLFCTPFRHVYSQAFSSFNQRNHPEIEWIESETTHFRLIYGKHISSIIPEVAAIAESTYTALSAGLGVEFDRKIKVYLSNEDEIVNGAATFFNGSYTFIWVELNDSPDFFSSEKKWYRKVISHELAHLFQFEASKSNLGFWGFAFGNTGGRSLTEGYAQYATEVWDAQRGDRWLRASIFEDRPSFNDGLSPYSGRLIYAKGYAQQLFVADQYGDSTITKMYAYRDTLAFGYTLPNVFKGFEKTTGESWGNFNKRWLRHVNVYYNTLASQMDRTDSLKGKEIRLNDLLQLDFKASPSGTKAVSSSYLSMVKPIVRTILWERDSTGFKQKKLLFKGGTNADFAWSSDEKTLYYSKADRAEYGSLVNDLYAFDLDTNKEERLTFGKRISSPVEKDKGELLAIQNIKGTGHIVSVNVESKVIATLSKYSDNTQLMHLNISPTKDYITFSKFDDSGNRTIEYVRLSDWKTESFTNGAIDDRNPIISPDGKSIAYNSLRDRVPNIFVLNLDSKQEERATFVFTGAELIDWVKTDSGKTAWVVKSSESKSKESLWLVADTIKTTKSETTVPEAYSSWTLRQPTHVIGGGIKPDASLLSKPKEYSHLSTIGHMISFGLPYVSESEGESDYGIQGFTSWADPLGKHQFITAGNISFVNPEYTIGIAQYLNATQSYTIGVSAFRAPSTLQFYSDNLLLSTISGFSGSIAKDLDWKPESYSYSRFMITTRAFLWEPSSSSIYTSKNDLNFGNAWQNDVIGSYEIKHILPYRFNDIHPLKGYGINVSVKAGLNAPDAWFSSSKKSFTILDFRWFDVRPILNEITWFSYFRAQTQFGSPLPFESVQLSRYDNFSLPAFETLPLAMWNNPDRARGYRTFILADQVYFNTFELRAPLLPTLATKILGLIELNKTTISINSDIAFAREVKSGSSQKEVWQWGLGAEIKNKMTLFGFFPVIHSFGYAQPYDKLFAKSPYDLYYKIQATIPF